MGRLVDGKWGTSSVVRSDGHFVRKPSSFRGWIRADGSTDFAPESGRYHLYVSSACPWAHRTIIFRALKRLEPHVGISIADPLMLEHGWELPEGADTVNGKRRLYEIYQLADAKYHGRVTVPALWDKKTGSIVSNESSEIIRMFNSELGALTDDTSDFYPAPLREQIDAINERVYATVNNGVYRCGFAGTQAAYEEAFDELFATLDHLDERLADNRYLCGDRLTEADWRLFTTLIRFDPVYYLHFKCNLRRIADYAHLSGYLRELYQVRGIRETVNMHHIKQHYYRSHESVNPRRLVPKGPLLDLDQPHGRDHLPAMTEGL